ncbi:MAG: chloride channel protein [Clostridia bacterium]|nr:chloride channel protein [Clostridia bacterium]
MKSGIQNHLIHIMMPSVVFSVIAGVLTGALVFAFRVISEEVILLSQQIFRFAGTHYWAIPLVVAGAVLVALLVSLCQRYSPHARGGGIPTAVALMRGLITFQWLRNVVFVFTSALLSYLCGIPLGNDEGPAVQMGTAIGSGTTKLLTGKKHQGWERYLMTGGATAGFAAATCAPISAVLFGLEEAHRRFSPLLLMSSISSVLSGMGTLHVLCYLTGREELTSLFHFTITQALPLRHIWMAILVGLFCGIGAYLLAAMTMLIRNTLHKKAKNVPHFLKIAPVFALVALIGCFFSEYHVIGTGHHLIESLISHREIWYIALGLLLVRAVLVILANDVGATGGLFTPILVFGALIGSMTAELLIALGAMDAHFFPLMVVMGMSAFFAGSVRTPLTAAIFAIEVFSGFDNVLPIFVSILISYVIVETIGVTSINEIAMEREIHKAHKGKARCTVDVELTVRPDCFAIGKEPRDILWPAFCHVLSVRKGEAEKDSYEGGTIHEGDILRLNFTTYDREATATELCAILGDQPVYENATVHSDPTGHRLSVDVAKNIGKRS